MQILGLNPGGILGGLLGIGAGIGIMFAVAEPNEGLHRRHIRWAIVGFILGAGFGNFLWSKLANSKPPRAPDQKDEAPTT